MYGKGVIIKEKKKKKNTKKQDCLNYKKEKTVFISTLIINSKQERRQPISKE